MDEREIVTVDGESYPPDVQVRINSLAEQVANLYKLNLEVGSDKADLKRIKAKSSQTRRAMDYIIDELLNLGYAVEIGTPDIIEVGPSNVRVMIDLNVKSLSNLTKH